MARSKFRTDQVGAGQVLQVVTSQYSAVNTGTGTIPLDDTVPQISEGSEFMTVTITPKSATSRLLVEASFFGTHNGGVLDLAVAIFRDATASALATDAATVAGTNYRVTIHIEVEDTANSTTATTFRLRAGAVTAATTTFNGASGSRYYGATVKSWIKVTEVAT